MPSSFNNVVHRAERVISTFSSLDRMPNLLDGLNISVNASYYKSDFQLAINDEHFELPNFNKYFEIMDLYDDVKFESGSYWTHHYGIESKIRVLRVFGNKFKINFVVLILRNV